MCNPQSTDVGVRTVSSRGVDVAVAVLECVRDRLLDGTWLRPPRSCVRTDPDVNLCRAAVHRHSHQVREWASRHPCSVSRSSRLAFWIARVGGRAERGAWLMLSLSLAFIGTTAVRATNVLEILSSVLDRAVPHLSNQISQQGA